MEIPPGSHIHGLYTCGGGEGGMKLQSSVDCSDGREKKQETLGFYSFLEIIFQDFSSDDLAGLMDRDHALH